MPRKSVHALSVQSIAIANPDSRPEPPKRLNAEEADEWRAIVARMPEDWFHRETWPVLEALCCHVRVLREVEREFKWKLYGNKRDAAVVYKARTTGLPSAPIRFRAWPNGGSKIVALR